VPRDYDKAVEWYRKSAEQGFAEAQYKLGLIYEEGLGVTQDYVEAHKWFNLAAARGRAGAKPTAHDALNLLPVVGSKNLPQNRFGLGCRQSPSSPLVLWASGNFG
jgi:TPR repeat protein